MDNLILPWQLMLIFLVGWLNWHQQAAIDYIKEENRILRLVEEAKRSSGGIAWADYYGFIIGRPGRMTF